MSGWFSVPNISQVIDPRVQAFADLVEARCPARHKQWAEAYVAGAAKAPSDFPGGIVRFGFFIVGLSDRETQAGDGGGYTPKGCFNGWGDLGNAYSIFQFDKRYHADFIASPEGQTLEGCGAYCGKLLAERWDTLKDERAMLAGYNASVSRVAAKLAANEDVDLVTTGKDYSSDTIRRIKKWYPEGFVTIDSDTAEGV